MSRGTAGIHMGYVRVSGRALDPLVWELGEVEQRRPAPHAA